MLVMGYNSFCLGHTCPAKLNRAKGTIFKRGINPYSIFHRDIVNCPYIRTGFLLKRLAMAREKHGEISG